MNEQKVEFGTQRACDVIRAHRKASAREIVTAIFEATVAFRGPSSQDDDMTAVVVKITRAAPDQRFVTEFARGSRRTALLLPQIWAIFLVVAPARRGRAPRLRQRIRPA